MIPVETAVDNHPSKFPCSHVSSLVTIVKWVRYTNQFVKYTALSYPDEEFEIAELPGDEAGEDTLTLLEYVESELDPAEMVREDATVVDEFR